MDRAPTVAADDAGAADRIVEVLAAGGTVLLPTDTVYGVAASTAVPGATEQLFALKERSAGQPVAVLVADVDQVRPLVRWPDGDPARWMAELWPGPLTIVLRRSDAALDLALGGDDPTTIGVRCPAHDLVRAVATRVGPIATTSANRSGQPTPSSAVAAAASLAGPVDLIVDGGPASTVASTVVDATTTPWRILRQGAVTEGQLGEDE